MKPEDMLEAFQYIDDDFIESADLIRRHPVPARSSQRKILAAAACLVIILGGISFMSDRFPGSDGAYDMADQNSQMIDVTDGADGKDNEMMEDMDIPFEQRGKQITLPAYESFTNSHGEKESIEYYSFFTASTGEDDTTDQKTALSESELLIETIDAFPVYTGLNLNSAYLVLKDLGVFEKELKKITSYEIYGYYFSIDIEKARFLLKEGAYLTFDNQKPVSEKTYQTSLVYLYDKEADLAVPYYHFYENDTEVSEGNTDLLSGWFVPAIEEKSIKNMPAN